MNPITDTRTLPLDSQLATRAFEQDTEWFVLTGAPCAGKTTVLQELAKHGFDQHPEIARVYIERQLADGKTLADIRADEGRFQRGLIESKLELELNTNPNTVVLFDRAMPDSITYYRVAGLDPRDVVDDCYRRRYAQVFLLDRLPLTADHARTEDDQTAAFVDEWLERDYRALGYDVIRVPLMPIRQRVNFVLARIRSYEC